MAINSNTNSPSVKLAFPIKHLQEYYSGKPIYNEIIAGIVTVVITGTILIFSVINHQNGECLYFSSLEAVS
jgi:hypothetical protein